MTLEQTTIAESERVQRLIDQAIEEIENNGGDMRVFIACLMDATIQLYSAAVGEDTLAETLTRIGMHELKRRGVKPC